MIEKFDPETIRNSAEDLRAVAAELSANVEVKGPFPIDWDEVIPHSDDAGVYLILDDDDGVLYVGKSQAALGYRFWNHLRKADDGQPEWIWGGEHRPRKGLIIPLPNNRSVLAPALESLLTRAFNPPWNVLGRRRDEPPPVVEE